jgi:hypothetical protein
MASGKSRSNSFGRNIGACLLSTWRRLMVRLPAPDSSTNHELASNLRIPLAVSIERLSTGTACQLGACAIRHVGQPGNQRKRSYCFERLLDQVLLGLDRRFGRSPFATPIQWSSTLARTKLFSGNQTTNRFAQPSRIAVASRIPARQSGSAFAISTSVPFNSARPSDASRHGRHFVFQRDRFDTLALQ